MTLATPKVSTPAQAPAPTQQGADALSLGQGDPVARAQGAIGRLALRVGANNPAVTGATSAAGNTTSTGGM